MTISVSVMAHRSRRDLVPALVDAVDAPVEVVWDRADDEWDTARRAWEAHDPAAGHHLVLQDDAIVCRDLVAGLARALIEVPADAVLSLYAGTLRPQSRPVADAAARADEAAASWIVMPAVNWGVAVLAPVRSIEGMVAWCERPTGADYDARLGRYYREQLAWPVWCPWPSLVDHLDGPSLIGHGFGRRAHRFIGESASALDVDWSAGAVEMQGMAALDRRRAGKEAVNHG